jgi:MFS family permease
VVFYGLFAIASELGEEHQRTLALVLLFVARIGQGIAGATIATAQAVIADSTTPERRSRGMALIGAAFGIGFTFGPLIGAGTLYFWPDALGAPGFAAAGLSLVSLILGIRLLPETLRPGSSAGHRRWLDWHGLQNALRTPTVGLLIVVFFLATFAFANFETTLSLFTKDTLQSGNSKNFLFFAYIGFMLMLAQGGIYQMMARRGVGEVTFIGTGVVLLILGLGGLAGTARLAGAESIGTGSLLGLFLLAVAIAVMGFAFVTPSAQALISRRSDPTKQGEILGVNQSAAALARILGPLIALPLYKLDGSHMLPYILATGLLLAVLALVPRLKGFPCRARNGRRSPPTRLERSR